MDDFDKGTDFDCYYPYNNLSVVKQEYENYVRYGQEAKPHFETEYEVEASEYLIDYYKID